MNAFSEEQLTKLKNFFHMKESPEEREIFLIRKTQKYAKLLSFIPGILFVGIGNSVAMNTAHKDSDIDLFIITRQKRLWTVRFLVTVLFSFIGQRKTAHHHKDLFCLSFFITEGAMDFSRFAIKNDIYLYFWILYLKPIINRNGTYNRFLEANKSWVNIGEYEAIIKENTSYIVLEKNGERAEGKIGDIFENICKKIWLPVTLRHYDQLGKPYGVIIGDNILKFHDKDLRIKVREEIFSTS